MPTRRVKVLCPKCELSTNHHVMESVEVSGSDSDSGIDWRESFQIIKCLGCDTVSFREEFASSEDYDPNTGESLITEKLYPERLAGRAPIDGSERFPARTRQVYREVIKALNGGAPILAAIGLRAVIESVCNDRGVKGASLQKRIDELFTMGLLSKAQAEFLHAHRFLGNMAAHEVIAPKPADLVAALDIAETLLRTLYVLPDIAASITTGRKPPPVKGLPTVPAPDSSADPMEA